jgi:hypothetical protein
MFKTRFEKLLKLAYGSILVLLGVIIVLSVVLSFKSNLRNECTTKACVNAGNLTKKVLDDSYGHNL